MTRKRQTKIVDEGQYVAEVDIELIYEDQAWSPYLSLEDALKLDDVRQALRERNLDVAASLARIFKKVPVTA